MPSSLIRYLSSVLLCLTPSLLNAAPPPPSPLVIQLPGPTLSEIQPRFSSAIQKVKNQAVAVNCDGEASGAIISPDGLIMTAGHVAMMMKPDSLATIELEDGSTYKAELLGYDLEIDWALYQITPKPSTPLPFCQLANQAPLPGAYCFTLSHPSGKIKNRPAQPRIGRILNVPLREGKPWIAMMDCNIQPGDSGGPIFDLDGKLIGVASSASANKRFNRCGVIDQLHANFDFLKTKGNHRGDFDKGPGGIAGYDHRFQPDEIALLEPVLQKRVLDQHQESVRFAMNHRDSSGKSKISQTDLINFLALDALAVIEHRPFSLGLDDPSLINPYKSIISPTSAKLPLKSKDSNIGFATRIAPNRLITTHHILQDKPQLSVSFNNQSTPATLVKAFPEQDLAILEIDPKFSSPEIKIPQKATPLNAGDLLLSIDQNRCLVIGNAMDCARPMPTVDSPGPVTDETPVNTRRGPFTMATTHSIPLYLGDEAAPVFNLKQEFVGIHIARSTRTYGVLLEPQQLLQLLEASKTIKKRKS